MGLALAVRFFRILVVTFHSERCCEVSLKIFMLIIIVSIFRVFILFLFGNENV